MNFRPPRSVPHFRTQEKVMVPDPGVNQTVYASRIPNFSNFHRRKEKQLPTATQFCSTRKLLSVPTSSLFSFHYWDEKKTPIRSQISACWVNFSSFGFPFVEQCSSPTVPSEQVKPPLFDWPSSILNCLSTATWVFLFFSSEWARRD